MVILNCSHCFHKVCFNSFENFVSKEGVKACPMCRKERFKKKETKIGLRFFERKCSIMLQKHVRGYLARKRYFQRRLATNPKLRKEYLLKKIKKINDTLERHVSDSSKSIDNLFEKMENQITQANMKLMNEKDWAKVTVYKVF